MSELIKIDSGTPEFDALLTLRYQEFPRLERELAQAKQLLNRAADALDTARQGGSVKTHFYSGLIAELRKTAQ